MGPDAERFTVLFERHHAAVLAYARRRADDQLAADVTAEVFLTAWRRLPDVPSDALPWLIGCARRALANQRRGQERVAALRLRLTDRAVAPAGAVDEQVSVAATWSAALRRLPAADQELLALFAWEGFTARQAATVLGCTEGAVVMRLHRARRRLRRHLREPDAEPDQTSSPASAPPQASASHPRAGHHASS